MINGGMMVKRLVKNTLYILGGVLGGKIIAALYFFLLALYLPQEVFGLYNLLTGIASFALLFTYWGLDYVIIKDVSRDRTGSAQILFHTLIARMFLSILGSIIFYGLLVYYGTESPIVKIGVIILITKIMEHINSAFFAVIRGHEVMEWEAFTRIVYRIIMLVFTYVAVRMGVTLIGITILYLVAMLSQGGLLVVIYKYVLKGGKILAYTGGLLRTMEKGLPFLFYELIIAAYNVIPILILGYYAMPSIVADFVVGYKIIGFLIIIPMAISSAMFPVVSRLYLDRKADKCLKNAIKYTMPIAIGMAFGIYLLADFGLTFLFSDKYRDASSVLRILAVMFPFSFMNQIMRSYLWGSEMQNYVAISYMLGLFVLIICAMLYIPTNILAAIPLALVSSEVAVFLVMGIVYSQRRRIKLYMKG